MSDKPYVPLCRSKEGRLKLKMKLAAPNQEGLAVHDIELALLKSYLTSRRDLAFAIQYIEELENLLDQSTSHIEDLRERLERPERPTTYLQIKAGVADQVYNSTGDLLPDAEPVSDATAAPVTRHSTGTVFADTEEYNETVDILRQISRLIELLPPEVRDL